MPIVTFDTCIWIKYQPSEHPKGHRMTAVVLHELTVGSPDEKTVRKLETDRREYEREGTLLVPNGEDWFLAGKVLNSLQRFAAKHQIKAKPLKSRLTNPGK